MKLLPRMNVFAMVLRKATSISLVLVSTMSMNLLVARSVTIMTCLMRQKNANQKRK
ncbi:Uncharacterised protein [Vibrio cholerae]|nr:Uncharacterised protein [Vibrio cholerae]